MTTKNFIRSIALAAFMAALAACAPNALRAQVLNVCNGCDHILVANSSNCQVTLCFLGEVIVHCRDIAPGSTGTVPCDGIQSIAVRDCSGNLHGLNPGCTTIAVGAGCCVRICLERDAAGCPVVRIGPSAIACTCE